MSDELKTESVSGVVVRRLKIVGGEEITLQVNDENDEQPISGTGGGFSAETDAEGKRAYAESQKGNEQDAPEQSKGADNEPDPKNTAEAAKTQAAKPSAVTKSNSSSVTK